MCYPCFLCLALCLKRKYMEKEPHQHIVSTNNYCKCNGERISCSLSAVSTWRHDKPLKWLWWANAIAITRCIVKNVLHYTFCIFNRFNPTVLRIYFSQTRCSQLWEPPATANCKPIKLDGYWLPSKASLYQHLLPNIQFSTKPPIHLGNRFESPMLAEVIFLPSVSVMQ